MEYDDKRYLDWQREFRDLVAEFLQTDGNTEEGLNHELEDAVADG